MKNNAVIKFIPYLFFIIYVLIVAFGSKESFPDDVQTNSKMPYLVDKPIGEDAYYMLTIAKNLASGNGFTYNFNKETTGIQPLATVLYSSVFVISNFLGLSDWASLRLIIVMNAILLILFTFTLLKTSSLLGNQSINLYWVVPLLTLFNFGLFRTFTYGLETGLYLLLLAITINYSRSINFKKMHKRRLVTLSALIGLTVLARIDFIVIVIFFFLIQFIQKNICIKNLFIIGLLSSLATLPWFIYVYSITGSFIPSSGSAQSDLATINSIGPRFSAMLSAIIENLTPWLYTGARNLIVIVGLFSLVIFIFFFRNYLIDVVKYSKNIKTLKEYYPWVISIIILILIYILFFWATHFYYRYSSPLSIFIIPVFGSALSRFFENKSKSFKYLFSMIIIILFFAQAYYSLHTGVIGNTHSVSAGYIRQNFSDTYKVGVLQSGVIGYFNHNVINLDGKIDKNSLIAIKNKSLHKYIDNQGINVLVDWPGYIYSNLDSNYLKLNWKEFSEKINNNVSICLVRK